MGTITRKRIIFTKNYRPDPEKGEKTDHTTKTERNFRSKKTQILELIQAGTNLKNIRESLYDYTGNRIPDIDKINPNLDLRGKRVSKMDLLDAQKELNQKLNNIKKLKELENEPKTKSKEITKDNNENITTDPGNKNVNKKNE